MDDIFSKINQIDNKDEDEGGNLANNIIDSMQNDQKKQKGYTSSLGKITIPKPWCFSRRKSVAKKHNFPPMDFVRAKQSLGIKTSATLEELSFDDVRQKFVMKVMRDSEKHDTRWKH